MKIKDPHWWRQRLVKFVIRPIHNSIQKRREKAGIYDYVSEEEWDVLIVYDACRHDLFEEVVNIDSFDIYKIARSPGSRTPEWSSRNWRGNEFGDVVYISSNAWIERTAGGCFHDIVSVWNVDEDVDTAEHIAAAEEVTEAALDARESYPNKRLIVHYGQPHVPFYPDGGTNPWDEVKRGNYPIEKFYEKYRENLEYVWNESEPLRKLDGRIVVTSDHGNMLGERLSPIPIKMFEHPRGLCHNTLRDVPYGVYEGDRWVVEDEGVNEIDINALCVEKNLKNMGYLE